MPRAVVGRAGSRDRPVLRGHGRSRRSFRPTGGQPKKDAARERAIVLRKQRHGIEEIVAELERAGTPLSRTAVAGDVVGGEELKARVLLPGLLGEPRGETTVRPTGRRTASTDG